MNTLANPSAALIVIGDEILSGRTKDVNIGAVADFCAGAGIDFLEARVVPDIEAEIVAALNALRTRYTYVFTTGGIGPTHDDITADAVAKAFGVPLAIDPAARTVLEDYCGTHGLVLNAARLRMARIPEGARLIANRVSAAPGFAIGNVHVLAGVPEIARAMLEALAPSLTGGRKILSITVRAGVGEGSIAAPFEALQHRYPEIKMGSYPRFGDPLVKTELVLRGADPARLDGAAAEVMAMVGEAHREAGLPAPAPIKL